MPGGRGSRATAAPALMRRKPARSAQTAFSSTLREPPPGDKTGGVLQSITRRVAPKRHPCNVSNGSATGSSECRGVSNTSHLSAMYQPRITRVRRTLFFRAERKADGAMSAYVIRYLATGGTITLCGCVVRVISLKMRLRFSRYVVDRAVEQGQPIDPVQIISAATSKGPPSARSTPAEPEAAASSSVPPPAGGQPGIGSR
jgi:hypothetical protein